MTSSRCTFLVVVCLLLRTSVSRLAARTFRLLPQPTSGPRRLASGWLEPSLVSCAVTCQSSFPLLCWSFMYNSQSGLCTPGRWLNDTEAPPSQQEGSLYLGYRCDTAQNFLLVAYLDTVACVRRFDYSQTYLQALNTCLSLNSYLYLPKTMDKYYLLRSFIDSWSWLGFNDMQTEGQFIWVDNGQPVDLDSLRPMFLPGEPNDQTGEEDCAEIWNQNPYLNDNNCDRTFHFVCEQLLDAT